MFVCFFSLVVDVIVLSILDNSAPTLMHSVMTVSAAPSESTKLVILNCHPLSVSTSDCIYAAHASVLDHKVKIMGVIRYAINLVISR